MAAAAPAARARNTERADSSLKLSMKKRTARKARTGTSAMQDVDETAYFSTFSDTMASRLGREPSSKAAA